MANFLRKHLRGVHVPHYKNTAAEATRVMPVPHSIALPMLQHMGAACEVVVGVGDEVKVGQMVGRAPVEFSAPVHSGVSGTVTAIDEFINPNGIRTKAVTIETDGKQTLHESVRPPEVASKEDFLAAMRASGLVGMGGAGFPVHIKLGTSDPVDTLIINAAECEPYITSDFRSCIEDADEVLDGIELLRKWIGFTRVIIGIEDNKKEAIELFAERCDPSIEIRVLESQYPQGGEKVLIYEATGKAVLENMLPSKLGIIVMNISTVAYMSHYIRTGMPLVARRLTVDGSAIRNPGNIFAVIGTRFSDIVEFCGGYRGTPGKLLMGGPMMGITLYNDEYSLMKQNNALLAFNERETRDVFDTACIRCGRCAMGCPANLMPAKIEKAQKIGDIEWLRELKVNLCMECGCCAYVCPAKRFLVLSNRLGKKMLREEAAKAAKKIGEERS